MHIEQTRRIEASKEEIWTFLTDFERMKSWMPDLVDEVPITAGPTRVGSTSRIRMKEGGKVVEYESEIRAYEPSSRLEVELRGGSLGKNPMCLTYRSSSVTGSTELAYTAAWQPHGFILRLLHPLIAVMSRRNTRAALDKLVIVAGRTR